MDFADDLLFIECFLHFPHLAVLNTNPTNYQWIFTKQYETDELVKQEQTFPDRYFNKILNDKKIICYVAPSDNHDTQRKLAFTDFMIQPTLDLFHAMLGHPGSQCMHATLQSWYHHLHLHMTIEQFACDKCQCAKPSGPGHGLLPDQDIVCASWEEVELDLIGPWPASTPHEIVELFALTCIDTTTKLVKITKIIEKSSNHIATRFENTWLFWYPKPMQVIHNNGGLFTGFAFQHLLHLLNIEPVPTTNKNPKANAISE